MSIIFNGELQTSTTSLWGEHLSIAFDFLRKGKHYLEYMKEKHPEISDVDSFGSTLVGRRFAMSCILHGFCALESTINYFFYELFNNPDSSRYVAEDKRELLVKKFVKTWDKKECIEKLQFLLTYSSSSIEIPANLLAKLRELNILRNWLVHGFTYRTTLLLEPIPDKEDTFTVIDSEDDINWKRKFPNTKFNSPLSLWFQDAYQSMFIVLEVFKLLSQAFSHPFNVIMWKPKPECYTFFYGSERNDVTNIIEHIIKQFAVNKFSQM